MTEELRKRRRHNYFLYEVTKRCQNNCVFCYNVWKEDGRYPKKELTTGEACAVLGKVIDETGCGHIALTGGEPLLKEGVFDIASYIASKGVTTILISNGKLLTRETVERSMDSGIRFFEVSLHSHRPEVHDRLVGRKGSFEEVIDAVLAVIESGGHVNTVFVAVKENIDSFREFVELNALLRVEWILFNRVACGGSCLSDWKTLAPAPGRIGRALESGAAAAERYKIGLSAGVQIQPCLLDLSKDGNVATAFCPLNDPMSEGSYFVIDPAGNVRMCNRSKEILGNLLERSFWDIVECREVDEFSRAIPEFCRDCKLASQCAGGCKADALSCFGTLDKPDPYLEMWKSRVKKPR